MNELIYKAQHWEISIEQAITISVATIEECSLEEKTPEQLIQNSKAWAIVYSTWNELVWCIFLMPLMYEWTEIYERWSLRIHPCYRWNKLWAKLMKELTDIHSKKPLVSITYVESVKKANQKLLLAPHTVAQLQWTKLRSVLEEGWKLHSKYNIYMNWTMQELFKELK